MHSYVKKSQKDYQLASCCIYHCWDIYPIVLSQLLRQLMYFYKRHIATARFYWRQYVIWSERITDSQAENITFWRQALPQNILLFTRHCAYKNTNNENILCLYFKPFLMSAYLVICLTHLYWLRTVYFVFCFARVDICLWRHGLELCVINCDSMARGNQLSLSL